MRQYRFIIGNAWGVDHPDATPMHYWIHSEPVEWKTACGEDFKITVNSWSGVHTINPYYDDDAPRCEDCLEKFLETDYGKKFGVQSPYIIKPVE